MDIMMPQGSRLPPAYQDMLDQAFSNIQFARILVKTSNEEPATGIQQGGQGHPETSLSGERVEKAVQPPFINFGRVSEPPQVVQRN